MLLEFFEEAAEEAPAQWPMFQSGTRRYVFPTFPYSLVYFVENDTLNVVAVAHDKRKPGYWRSRLHRRPTP